jgi:hypothetical protein
MSTELTLEELENNMYKAELEYLCALKNKYLPIFEHETKDKIINDFHYLYKYYFGTNQSYNEVNFEKVSVSIEPYKRMFKEIILKIHPDKNIGLEEKANKAFVKFSSFNNDEHINTISYLYNYINSNDFLDKIINYKKEDSNKEEIIKIKCQIWYIYLKDVSFKSLYISKEEYEKIKILSAELEETKNKNEELLNELHNFRKEKS